MADKLNDRNAPFYEIFDCLDHGQLSEAADYVQQYFNCDSDTATMVLAAFKEQCYDTFKKELDEIISQLSPAEIARNNAIAREWLNKPKCPTCGSTNVKKIGGWERGVSVAVLGVFSNKINKSFKCGNCGYTW